MEAEFRMNNNLVNKRNYVGFYGDWENNKNPWNINTILINWIYLMLRNYNSIINITFKL